MSAFGTGIAKAPSVVGALYSRDSADRKKRTWSTIFQPYARVMRSKPNSSLEWRLPQELG